MAATRQPANQQELTDLEVRVAVAMRELRRGGAMQRFRDRLYGSAPVVLDIGQHDALEVVFTLGEARMGDVAAALRVDPSTATRTIARLEALGLVERRRADDDARAVVVALTDAGNEVHDTIRDVARAAFAQLFSRFTEEELTLLADLTERLVAGFDELTRFPAP